MGLHIPPPIAALLTVACIIFLFRRDTRETQAASGALWLPLLWMVIACSRPIGWWLNIFGFQVSGPVSLEEGSLVDACFYFALIISGIYVLSKRQVQLSEIFRNNGWLMAFLLYCFLSIIWSDFPFVAFKRWIKVLGHPVMVLILLTESDPEQAIVRLMKRCAYIVVLVSILFIKYYPEWGRGYDDWSGAPLTRGIAEDKNALGHDCLILGCFFFWYWLQTRRTERSKARRNELLLTVAFLAMIWWLVSLAHSSTSLLCLVLGVTTIALLGLRSVNKRLIGTYIVVAVIIWFTADAIFGVYSHVLQLLNKDPTLTDRTLLWSEVLSVNINPLFGAGFESFWLGDRLRAFAGKHWWQPNQAHNGYLETYVNLGLIGLFLLIGLLIATFRKIRLALLTDFEFGRFRLGFLIAVVLYNWTESSFKTTSPIWFVFYIIALEYPKFRASFTELAFDAESETNLVYAQDELESA
jgi:exopolysaccharide production protein ExoQ